MLDIFEQMISEYAWLKLHIDNRDIRVSKRAKSPDQVYMSGQKTFNLYQIQPRLGFCSICINSF